MTFLTQIRKIKKFLVASVFTACLAVGLLNPLAAWASTYGSGGYNTCGYDTSCPASTSKTTPPATTTTPTVEQILLNDFADYFSAAGKELTLEAGQVVYFDVTANGIILHKSVTIVAVGDNYVDIMINIDSTDVNFRLYIGDRKQYDVNNDGTNDIEITLKSILGGKATMIFRAVLGTDINRPSGNTTNSTSLTKRHLSWLWIIICLIIFLLGLFLFIILRRHRKRDDDIRPPNPPIQPLPPEPPLPPTIPTQPPMFNNPATVAPAPPLPAASPPSSVPQQWQ